MEVGEHLAQVADEAMEGVLEEKPSIMTVGGVGKKSREHTGGGGGGREVFWKQVGVVRVCVSAGVRRTLSGTIPLLHEKTERRCTR